ncbi:MAG TPA: riboflavin synthase [Thermoanaerobaculia bacterium]|nr:riboflavin synthase [Thermoanaerobaculia bacterium]
MFTGIIRNMGTLEAFEPLEAGARIIIGSIDVPLDLEKGESVAVNGVCVTVFPDGARSFHADLSPETLRRTTFERLPAGRRVNLERAMRLSERLGGHIVQGHVDTVATLVTKESAGDFSVYRWRLEEDHSELLVQKGSIAVDGVSLTIVDPAGNEIGVALIPETLQKTNLGACEIGDPSNIEIDILAKYARRLLEPYRPGVANR